MELLNIFKAEKRYEIFLTLTSVRNEVIYNLNLIPA